MSFQVLLTLYYQICLSCILSVAISNQSKPDTIEKKGLSIVSHFRAQFSCVKMHSILGLEKCTLLDQSSSSKKSLNWTLSYIINKLWFLHEYVLWVLQKVTQNMINVFVNNFHTAILSDFNFCSLVRSFFSDVQKLQPSQKIFSNIHYFSDKLQKWKWW